MGIEGKKRPKRLLAILTGVAMAFTTFTGMIPGKDVKAAETQKTTKRNVMYYGDWSIWGGQDNFYPKDIPADKLTHLNFAFIYFDANGNLVFTDKDAATGAPVGMDGVQWGGSNAGVLNAFQDLKAKNPNLKIGISVGGWSKSHNFSTVCANSSTRATLVSNLVKFMDYNNMDFIDIDWEYPCSKRDPDKCDNENDEGTKQATEADKANFVLLLKDLREALDKKGSNENRTYELSVAIPASKASVDLGIDVPGVFKYVDFANIMTYDMRGAWDDHTGHQTGLYSNPNDNMKGYGLSVDESVKYYMSKGAPAEKIVIGAAYYSRGWGKVSPGPDANNPGLFGAADICGKDADQKDSRGALNEAPLKNGDGGRRGGVWSYRSFDKLKAAYPGLKEYWDDTAKAPYMYDEKEGVFVTYDNVRSIQEKAKYVNANNLGGMIAWMAGQDKATTSTKRDELTNATAAALFGGTALPTYQAKPRNLDVTCTLKTYTEVGIAGGGYEIAISNNEKAQESGEVMQLVEKSGETIKSPKLYIKTSENLVSGDYTSGTVTREGDYIVVDISKVYEGKTIGQGGKYTVKLKAPSAPENTNSIKSIELEQRIFETGTPLGKQVLYTNGGVVENTKPVINGADAKTITVGDTFDAKAGVTATDKEDGDLTSKIVISGSVDTTKAGSYTLTYTVTDNGKLTTTVNRVITVVKKDDPTQNTQPVISGIEAKTIYVGDKFDPKAGVTATDKEDGDLTSKIVITGSVDTSKEGSYTLTYSVTDSGNLTDKVTRVITVVKKGETVYEAWSRNTAQTKSYPKGSIVSHKGKIWEQVGAAASWYGEPGVSSEWKAIGDDPNYVEVISAWNATTQSSQGYAPGTKVTHNGKTYIQSGSGTVWYGEPGTPAGNAYWKEV